MLSPGLRVLAWDAPRGPLGSHTSLGIEQTHVDCGPRVLSFALPRKPACLGPDGALSERVPVYSPTLRRCSASGAQRLVLEPAVGLQPDSLVATARVMSANSGLSQTGLLAWVSIPASNELEPPPSHSWPARCCRVLQGISVSSWMYV